MATYVRTQSIEHAVGERGSVSIKVTEGDVRIQGVSGPDARIRATFEIRASSDKEADDIFEAVKLRVVTGPGTLSAEEPGGGATIGKVISRLFSGAGHADLAVEAFLPPDAQLHLSGVSSDVEASGLRGDQRYSTVSGDLRLVDAGGSLQLMGVSGDTAIASSESISVAAESVSGDVAITAPRLRSLQASTVSGDIELEAELSIGGAFSISTVSGDLSIGLLGSATFEIRGLSTDVHSEIDHRLEGRSDRRRLIIGQGGPTVVFSSMSGDVEVRRPRHLARRPEQAPAAQLEILRLLESGEITVDEATSRLAGGPSGA